MELSPSIERYNVTMILVVGDNSGNVSWTLDDIGEIIRAPFQVAGDSNGYEFISAIDQLGLEIRPSSVIVNDLSSAMPVRTEFIDAVKETIEFMQERHVEVVGYGWNSTGVLSDVDLSQVIGGLFNQSKVDQILGLRAEQGWVTPRVEFAGESNFSDRAMLTLALGTGGEPAALTLRFAINSHFDRPPDTDKLADEGIGFREVLYKTLDSLVTRELLEDSQ